MKKLSLPKVSIGILLFSLPINFIVFSGLGNVYVSTLHILFLFASLLLIVPQKLVIKKAPVYGILLFGILLLTTILNLVFDSGSGFKMQLVFSIVYFQGFLVFIISHYALGKVKMDYIFKIFLVVGVLLFFRIVAAEPQNLFNLSTVRGERIEANFAGAVNNFALLTGLSLIISFFYIKNKLWKVVLSIFFLFVLILTMSRGALLGTIFTFFMVAFYDTDSKTLKNFLRISASVALIGIVGLFYLDKVDLIVSTVQDRFFGFFDSKTSIKQFSSGRGLIFMDIYNNHFRTSSPFELLFGHGMGSIDFKVNGHPYQSSHNIFMDFAFRNGLLFLFTYFLFFIYLLGRFIANRNKGNLVLFGIFIFLHFELLVNPYLFAVQMGWIYSFFLAAFLTKLHTGNKTTAVKQVS